MAKLDAEIAASLTHSDLNRIDQAVGLIWSAYPEAVDFDDMVNLLEAAGLSKQNRSRLRNALKASRLVFQGKLRNSFRLSPRYVAELSDKFAPIVGTPKKIRVADAAALVPNGTLPLNRGYVAAIVRQVNEGYTAGHYDSVAVMIRRLTESLLIECYIHANREADIRVNGGNFPMLDGLITIFAGDSAFSKSRNLLSQLRKIKAVGDSAAHSRIYITKKADIDDIKAETRRCLNEMATLAGL